MSTLEQLIHRFETQPEKHMSLLLDYAKKVKPLPEALRNHGLFQDESCKTPFYLHSDIDDKRQLRVYVDALPDSLLMWAFGGILQELLWEENIDLALKIPKDLHRRLGLDVSLGLARAATLGVMILKMQSDINEQLKNDLGGSLAKPS